MPIDYNKEPITIGSGTVMPELKEKLYKKYPLTEEEKLTMTMFNIDSFVGKRLVMLAEEYLK